MAMILMMMDQTGDCLGNEHTLHEHLIVEPDALMSGEKVQSESHDGVQIPASQVTYEDIHQQMHDLACTLQSIAMDRAHGKLDAYLARTGTIAYWNQCCGH